MSLQGNLTDLPLIDLLQIFSVQNKKGVLQINHGVSEAEIFFEAASLRAAYVYENLPQGRFVHSQGEEAIYDVMDWPEGHFHFSMTDVNIPHRNIFVSWNYLVLEQCRRQDEREREKHFADIGKRIPHLVPDPPVQAQINLSLDEWRVLLQVNSSSSVVAIANAMRQPLDEVIKNLEDLEQKGLIELNNVTRFTGRQAATAPLNQPPSYAMPTNQVSYYTRSALAAETVTMPAPTPIYKPAARPALFREEVAAVAPPMPTVITRVEKPKVQRGLISGIMAKIKGL